MTQVCLMPVLTWSLWLRHCTGEGKGGEGEEGRGERDWAGSLR